MAIPIELLLLVLGGIAGFLSGLLGIGGATVLIPLLMFITPLLGIELTFHQITGLSMTQVFFSALAGAATHFKGGNLKKELIIYIGGAMLVTSFIGATASAQMSQTMLQSVFAIFLGISIVMLLKPKKGVDNQPVDLEKEYITTPKEKIIGISLGGMVGIVSGMVGVGGAVILIPAISYVLNVPIKICIGTSLGIILAGGITGFIGKAATGQVPLVMAAFLVVGAIAGARFGSKVSMKVQAQKLRKMLGLVLIITLLRILYSLYIG